MIAIDTNILIFAHRADSPFHADAQRIMEQLENGVDEWSIPSSCLREFFSSVTHPKSFEVPTPPNVARGQIEFLLTHENLVILSENGDYWECLVDAIASANVTGKHVHDAHIAAICITHSVSELWTADDGFTRFPGLIVRNPLVREEADAETI